MVAFEESVQLWEKGKPLVFPYRIPGPVDFNVPPINVSCPTCGPLPTPVRGTTTDREAETEFKVVAPCLKCKTLNSAHFVIKNDKGMRVVP